MDLSNYKALGIVLENCEYIEIPIKYVKQLKLTDFNDCEEVELHCILEGIDEVEYNSYHHHKSPYKRLREYADIVRVTLIKHDGEIDEYDIVWYDYCEQENKYQEVIPHAFNKIEISVKITNINKHILEESQNLAVRLLDTFQGVCIHCNFRKLCDAYEADGKHQICRVLTDMKEYKL